MLKTTALLFALSAIAMITVGCAENTAKPQIQHTSASETNEVVVTKQPLPVWQPIVGRVPKLTKEDQRELADSYADLQSPEDNPTVWAIHGNSCSWYCGGEDGKVIASSTLPHQGTNSYKATNAHDLGYDTAWVEGVDGPGIDETLIYTFTNQCPRITDILIHNGYIKDKATWLKNNRVKVLEFAINGTPTALLQLADTRAEQSFDLELFGIGSIGRRADGQDLVLTFKILDVYPGTTYDDTAISEIYFDGIDVH